MFYHQILLRRRGQFGLIWMEAMQSSPLRVTNRQALQVDVKQSCCRIAEYINYPADGAESNTKRFSLYLSAHLMYGVVSIWRKQVLVLLSDVQEIKSRVGSDINILSTIDLRQPRFDQVNIADALPKVVDEDPFFGSLKRFNENWDTFIQEQLSPDVPSPTLLLSPLKRHEHESEADAEFEQELGHPHTVPKEEITLKELPFSTSPLLEVQIPGEIDIPEVNGKELNVVIDQPVEEIDLRLQDLYPDGLPIHRLSPIQGEMSPSRRERTPDKAGTRKVDGRPKGEKKRRKRDADELNRTQLQEIPPPKRPAREEDIVLEPAVQVTPPRRTRPRRRLLFLDEKMELSKSEMKNNFHTTATICREFKLPQPPISTPSRLFKAPATKGILNNPVMRRLWERNCRSEETDSDWDFPVKDERDRRTLDRVKAGYGTETPNFEEDAGAPPADDQPMEDVHPSAEQMVRDAPSMETVREGSLSRSRTPQQSPLLGRLGQSPAEDRSLSGVGQPDRSRERGRRGSSLEGSAVSGEELSAAPLGVLPEEVEEMMLSPPVMPNLPEEEGSSPERKFKEQCEKEGEGKYTTFRALCPPKVTPRQRAVKCFTALLEPRVRERLFVRQLRPYGDIYISTDPYSLPESDS